MAITEKAGFIVEGNALLSSLMPEEKDIAQTERMVLRMSSSFLLLFYFFSSSFPEKRTEKFRNVAVRQAWRGGARHPKRRNSR